MKARKRLAASNGAVWAFFPNERPDRRLMNTQRVNGQTRNPIGYRERYARLTPLRPLVME